MEGLQRIIITPAMAEKTLKEKNPYNRPISRVHVDFLASEMKRGNFRFNGDPIRFDINGNLMDGQHRLAAAVKAGMPLDALVVYNINPEAMDTIDCGKKRSLTDKLKMRGVINASLIGSAVTARMAYFNGDFSISGKYSDIDAVGMLTDDQYKIMLEAGRMAQRVYHSPLRIRPAAFAGLVSICLEHDRQKTEEMIEKLVSGESVAPGDPCLAYRRAVAKAAPNRYTWVSTKGFVCLTIAFFNAVFSGKKIKSLSVTGTDTKKPLFFAPVKESEESK